MKVNNEILKSNLKKLSSSKDLKNKDRELYKCVLNLFMVSTLLIKYETLLNSKGFENSIGSYLLKHLNNILVNFYHLPSFIINGSQFETSLLQVYFMEFIFVSSFIIGCYIGFIIDLLRYRRFY